MRNGAQPDCISGVDGFDPRKGRHRVPLPLPEDVEHHCRARGIISGCYASIAQWSSTGLKPRVLPFDSASKHKHGPLQKTRRGDVEPYARRLQDGGNWGPLSVKGQ